MAQKRLNQVISIATAPSPSRPWLLAHAPQQQQGKHLHITRSSKSDELAAMQNFKSGLDEALKTAAATAGKEAAAAEVAAAAASGAADLPSLEGPSFWSTIRSLPPTQLAIVLCYTNSCIPCKAAKPQIIQWVKEKGDKMKGYKFQLSLPNKEVALAMNVKTSPVFLFFRNGELIETIRGGKELLSVKEFMDKNA